MGGKPNPGTKPDKRLTENVPPPGRPGSGGVGGSSRPMIPNAAPPFGGKGKGSKGK